MLSHFFFFLQETQKLQSYLKFSDNSEVIVTAVIWELQKQQDNFSKSIYCWRLRKTCLPLLSLDLCYFSARPTLTLVYICASIR